MITRSLCLRRSTLNAFSELALTWFAPPREMCRSWENYFRKVLLSMIEHARLNGRQIFLRESGSTVALSSSHQARPAVPSELPVERHIEVACDESGFSGGNLVGRWT